MEKSKFVFAVKHFFFLNLNTPSRSREKILHFFGRKNIHIFNSPSLMGKGMLTSLLPEEILHHPKMDHSFGELQGCCFHEVPCVLECFY